MEIDLKCYSPRFREIRAGLRSSDIRPYDRDFNVGDILHFHEGENNQGVFEKTGEVESRKVILLDQFGVQQGYINIFMEKV